MQSGQLQHPDPDFSFIYQLGVIESASESERVRDRVSERQRSKINYEHLKRRLDRFYS